MPDSSHDTTPAPWDGEPGWPRPRHVPMHEWGKAAPAASAYVQEFPNDSVPANTARLQRCFDHFVCQVCGEPVQSVDSVGWVLEPEANMGGACCTRCMYLAVRVCPHLADAPTGGFTFWAVTSPDQYDWFVLHGYTKGKVVHIPHSGATEHDWNAFATHYRAWKTAARVNDHAVLSTNEL